MSKEANFIKHWYPETDVTSLFTYDELESIMQAYADESRIEELEWVKALTESVRLNNLIESRIEELKQLDHE